MERPDWHYGDVLAHPMMRDLQIMFIAWSEILPYTLHGMVLTDRPSSAAPFGAGTVRDGWEWGKQPGTGILIEEGPR